MTLNVEANSNNAVITRTSPEVNVQQRSSTPPLADLSGDAPALKGRVASWGDQLVDFVAKHPEILWALVIGLVALAVLGHGYIALGIAWVVAMIGVDLAGHYGQ